MGRKTAVLGLRVVDDPEGTLYQFFVVVDSGMDNGVDGRS